MKLLVRAYKPPTERCGIAWRSASSWVRESWVSTTTAGMPATVRGLAADTDAARLNADADWRAMLDGHSARLETFASFLAEHGLRHTFLPGESPREFDERLAGVDFPPPLGAGRSVDASP